MNSKIMLILAAILVSVCCSMAENATSADKSHDVTAAKKSAEEADKEVEKAEVEHEEAEVEHEVPEVEHEGPEDDEIGANSTLTNATKPELIGKGPTVITPVGNSTTSNVTAAAPLPATNQTTN